MMVSIVAVSFTLLSAAFMLLSYRYILSEKRQALERNAEDIASLTSRYISSAWGGDIQGEAFRNSLYLIVRSSDSYVVLSDGGRFPSFRAWCWFRRIPPPYRVCGRIR